MPITPEVGQLRIQGKSLSTVNYLVELLPIPEGLHPATRVAVNIVDTFSVPGYTPRVNQSGSHGEVPLKGQ